jgi:hypothetical protein
LIDRRRHSTILDVRSFRGADCDTDHYLVIAKVRGRVGAVSKRPVNKMDMDRFDLKKLKNSIRLQSKQIFSSGKLKRIMGTLIGYGTLLERT